MNAVNCNREKKFGNMKWFVLLLHINSKRNASGRNDKDRKRKSLRSNDE